MSRTVPRSRLREALSYRIELWNTESGERRVLARALNAALARAIFRAATAEHPEARVTLNGGNRIIANSTAEQPRLEAGK
jgi:hypothetical protein